MFSDRKVAYSKPDPAAQTKEERMKKLKTELRDHIRFLGCYEILSSDWLQMAESLHQIANVAYMETHMAPSAENPLLHQGKHSVGTLWDQERDEIAVRILLEEGKLNLLMRILHLFKQAMREESVAELKKNAAQQFNCDLSAVESRCRVFEQSVGTLLKYSVDHVEALQILDLPELITHCKEMIIDSALQEHKAEDMDRMQETLVIHYLFSIANKIEYLDEDRIMDIVEQEGIVPLFVSHLRRIYPCCRTELLKEAAQFLNDIMATDAFVTDSHRFISADSTKKEILDLQVFFVNELLSCQVLVKKQVQTLLDTLTKYERQFGRSKAVPQSLLPPSQAPAPPVLPIALPSVRKP